MTREIWNDEQFAGIVLTVIGGVITPRATNYPYTLIDTWTSLIFALEGLKYYIPIFYYINPFSNYNTFPIAGHIILL